MTRQRLAPMLRAGAYGRRTFFKDGGALGVGDRLALPEVAATLESIADQGPDYMYKGKWAREFVALVRGLGNLGFEATFEPRQFHYDIRTGAK